MILPAVLLLGGLAQLPAVPRRDALAGPAPAGKAPPDVFECRWTDTPITIDGNADEEAWKHAQVIDHFALPWLGSKSRPARTATRAKLLWDREYLYFCADMDDTDLVALDRGDDGAAWEEDIFEMFLKPASDKTGYYEFAINPAGTRFDRFLPRRGGDGNHRFKNDGDLHVETKVRLRGTLNQRQDRDSGWSVEGRIAWRELLRTGGRPEPDERWQFALCRCDVSAGSDEPELSTCAPLRSLTHPDFHHHEDYATLCFVGPRPGETANPFGIERRVPLTTSRVVGSPDPPPPYRVKRVYPNLKMNFPIAVRRQPGSDRFLFITEAGPYGATVLRRMKDDPNVTDAETLLDLDGVAYDIAFHPDFAHNGYVYIGWNGPSSAPGEAKRTKVTRYTIDPKPPYRFDPKSARLIIEWPSNGHNGGAVAFGLDGMLYVTSGDGTSDSDTNIVGQDLTRLTAKVLRINVDHPDPGREYSVPPDNPFVGVKDVRPETWAYGLRNPWRITVDEKTGHVWVGQNGQDLWEQAYLVRKGENYGWSVTEGSHPFYPNRKAGPTPIVKPTVEHPHSEFRSLTGGLVYQGERFPELRGAYLYGDYSTGQLWGIRHDGEKALWHRQLASTRLQITGFGLDSHGEILIADHRGQDQGGFYTLEATPKDLAPSTFPRRLSDSGLFRSVKGHVVEPGLIPYSVNAPLWSDGAYKERYIALPGADSHIDFTRSRGWGFPERTVLVKSFALELQEGNPASRRWVETRFLTNQQGEWFGYTYVWNDEQTDAALADAKGLDRDFTIRTAGGTRTQTWHYPSRSECMVCHSRAANFVLGPSELQMNKVHDYGGVRDNQLRTLEHLGVLRVNWAEEARAALRDELKEQGKSDKDIDAYLEKQAAAGPQRAAGPSSLLAFAPEKYRHLADPYDPKEDLAARARSYLHANCAQCHVEAGGGNAQMELEITTPLEKARILDVKPLHHTFDLRDARIIAPGSPERSVLLYRMNNREAGHMPPLATSRVDRDAVAVLRAWIEQLKTPGPK
jgi:uncharacterized repeat protein (TIGR03806 family)